VSAEKVGSALDLSLDKIIFFNGSDDAALQVTAYKVKLYSYTTNRSKWENCKVISLHITKSKHPAINMRCFRLIEM